ncbi:hypothetical protein [Clostridium sp.]|uniref:hypothetical protein n=1 Tax=Clostridium sp. TaxID=1506 RepID=UPI003463D415
MDININVNFNCKELIKLLTLSARFFEALDEKESKALDGDDDLPEDKEDGLIWKLEDVKGEREEKDAKKEKASVNFTKPMTKEEIESENFQELITKEEKLKGQDAYVLCKEEVTLGDIREKLAAMSQKGEHERVRQLLIKYGGERLSDVPRERYSDLLKEANGL